MRCLIAFLLGALSPWLYATQPSPSGSLPWTGLELKIASVLQLGPLSTSQIVERLRSRFSIKILYVESPPYGKKSLQWIKQKNRKEDLQAARYYSELRKTETDIVSHSPDTLGEYLPKYMNVHHPDGYRFRPYMNHPIILLTPSATREVVIHEFLHFLLDEALKQPIRIVEGKKYHSRDISKRKIESLRKRANKLLRKVGKIQASVVTSQSGPLYNTFFDTYMEWIDTALNVMDLATGEHIDMLRLTYTHRKPLRLTDFESNRCLAFYVSELRTFLKELSTITQQPNLEELRIYLSKRPSPKLEKKYKALNLKIDGLIKKANQAYAWAKQQVKLQPMQAGVEFNQP